MLVHAVDHLHYNPSEFAKAAAALALAAKYMSDVRKFIRCQS
jgi:hypothetical protein